jgi:hypothetical protein
MYHAPVLLQLGSGLSSVAHPFKLNPAWLREEYFDTLVRDVWSDLHMQQAIKAQRRLVERLSCLKSQVKFWSMEKCFQDQLEMDKIEEGLNDLYHQKTQGLQNADIEQQLMKLEEDRKKLLLEEEERWRQKSRAIWIKSGDNNSKLFHVLQAIKEIKSTYGRLSMKWASSISGQEAIKDEVINFFKSFYQDSGPNYIGEQIATVRLFPRMVTEDEVINL